MRSMQLEFVIQSFTDGLKKSVRRLISLEKRKIFFAVSVAVILVGFVFMGVNAGTGKGALNYSLEFKGGTSTNVTFDKAYTLKRD